MTSSRIRPSRVLLGVGGTLLLLAAGGAAVAFGPAAVEAFELSRPADRPVLPAADPVASAAQEQLEAAGGATWTGAVFLSDRTAEVHEGTFDLSEGCSTRVLQTHPDDPAAGESYEVVVEDGYTFSRYGDGSWTRAPYLWDMQLPTFMDLYAGSSACSFVEDFSRATGPLERTVDLPGLPTPPVGTTRYVGEVDRERFEALARYRTFELLSASTGSAPSRGELELAEADYSGVSSSLSRIALDVDSSGMPVAVWLVSPDEGAVVVDLTFTGFGPEDVTAPAEYEDAEDVVVSGTD